LSLYVSPLTAPEVVALADDISELCIEVARELSPDWDESRESPAFDTLVEVMIRMMRGLCDEDVLRVTDAMMLRRRCDTPPAS
jgi:hypothetical protein